MTTRLLVELNDGRVHPLADCDWVFYDSCGCPTGTRMAVSGDVVLYDEKVAMAYVFGDGTKTRTPKLVKARYAAGTTAVLMTHQQWIEQISPAMAAGCPHRAQPRRAPASGAARTEPDNALAAASANGGHRA